MKPTSVLFLSLITSICVFAQQPTQSGPLSNQCIIELVHSGVRSDELARIIATAQQVNFDLSPTGTNSMMQSGVTEDTIKAMAAREAGVQFDTSQPPSNLTPPRHNYTARPGGVARTSDIQQNPSSSVALERPGAVAGAEDRKADILPKEIGLYILQDGQLVPVQSEVADIKIGGIAQAMLTSGVKQTYTRGVLSQPHSDLRVVGPIAFIIKTPDGFSVADVRLLRLEVKKDRRTFRELTSNSHLFPIVPKVAYVDELDKNAVPMSPKVIGNNTWQINLNLQEGEYGFFKVPDWSKGSPFASTDGKVVPREWIYTFGVE